MTSSGPIQIGNDTLCLFFTITCELFIQCYWNTKNVQLLKRKECPHWKVKLKGAMGPMGKPISLIGSASKIYSLSGKMMIYIFFLINDMKQSDLANYC